MSPESGLAVAAALHAGFQLTVTALVYPALTRVPASGWPAAHARHSRAITPLVGLCYGSLLAAGAWVLLGAALTVPLVVALALVAACVLVTAASAAPTHGRLGRSGPDPALLDRLLAADRWRAALAVAALAASLAALPLA